MLYHVEIKGVEPLIMHSDRGMDETLPINVEKAEIVKTKASSRTTEDVARLAAIECEVAMWIDGKTGFPTIPAHVLQKCLRDGAATLRAGKNVSRGVRVQSAVEFSYDRETYGISVPQLSISTQFTASVKVGQARIARTRAKFDPPWGCKFSLRAEDDLVDQRKLERWLEIAGSRIGMGDWRPDKSGFYGVFEVVSINADG